MKRHYSKKLKHIIKQKVYQPVAGGRLRRGGAKKRARWQNSVTAGGVADDAVRR
jgi:hypothetical protein